MDPRKRRQLNCCINSLALVAPIFYFFMPMVMFLMRRFWPEQYRRLNLLKWALESLDDQRYEEVESYALKLLETVALRPSRDTGDTIHDGNQILGLSRLRQGDVEKAKEYLLKAGQTPECYGGPSMILARELLQKGEKEVVLQYLDLVEVFYLRANPEMEEFEWHRMAMKQQAENMDRWKTMVRAGEIPDDKYWTAPP